MSYYYDNSENYGYQDVSYPGPWRGRGQSRGRSGPSGRRNFQNSQNFNQFNQQRGNPRGQAPRTPRQRGGGSNSIRKPEPEKVLDGIPKPQHLSKTASEEKNDPLYAEAFFTEESQALSPEADLREIHTSLEGLDKLAETLHGYCVSHSSGFAKRVPESVLAYYCAVYGYARMLDVQRTNFRGLTFEEKEFLAKIKEFENQIPKSLATILSGLGNTRMPSGRELKFRMINRDYHDGEYLDIEIPGYFGRAGPQTQAIYKGYPCIAVYTQRILADLAGVENWDLPANIRPLDGNAQHPNANMLCYQSAVNIGREQVSFLATIGITADSFPFNNGSIALNIPLMLATALELSQVKGIQLAPFPNVPVGSTGQIPYSTALLSVLPGTDSKEDQILRSPCQISNPVAFVATCAKYRSICELSEVVENLIQVSWCIYDYVNADIPAAFIYIDNITFY